MDKKYLKIAVIALAILAIFLIAKSCKLSPKINKLQGEIALRDTLIEEGDKALSEVGRALEQASKSHEKRLAELNGLIDSSNTVIARLEEEGHHKTERIEELEETFPQLSTAEEKIEYWKTWGTEWKEQFQLCSQVVVEKDKIIFSLTEKYEAEQTIRLSVEQSLNLTEKQLLLLQAQVHEISSLNQTLIRKFRWSKSVRTGTTLAFVGVVAYLFLRPLK